jgi:glc operon protein GlcG
MTAVLLAATAPLCAHAQATAAKKTLTLEGAKKAIAAAVAQAREAGATGVVAVVDDGGSLMALERIDGTFAAGADISIGKARTAVLFRRPTRFFEEVIGKGRTAMVAVDFTPLQGGVPILVDGQVVGGIGVSGAASAAQDEELALAGAAALAGGAR